MSCLCSSLAGPFRPVTCAVPALAMWQLSAFAASLLSALAALLSASWHWSRLAVRVESLTALASAGRR